MATKVKLKRSSALPGASPRVGLGEVQLGQTGLKRSYGYVYEELLPQLSGLKAINVYQEMAQNSSVIGAVLFAIDMFMRKVAWRVESASESPADQQKAKFLESCRDDMDHTWADFISEINTMLIFGWSWFEIVYKQRFDDTLDEFGSATSQWNDGMIGWKKFMPISQDSWWRWDFDPETGQTIGMWQRPAPDYSERYLPIGKSLHFRTTSRKDNPEGVSILRTAYRSWYFLKRIEEIEAIGVERDLAGIPMATVPAEMLGENASADDKAMVQSIIKMVQNVRRDEQDGIVWPAAYDEKGNDLYTFKLLTSGGSRQFPTEPIISRYQSNIAMTALADFLLLGNDSTSNGSYALATSKSSMFQSALETWLNGIENVLNQRAVPLLFRQNGITTGPYPKFRHDIVQKPTLPDLATLISSMAGAGAQLFPDIELENHIREYAELPIREPNEQNRKLEEQIVNQDLDTMLASAAAEEDIAQRTARDANAEGIVPNPQGSLVARMEPLTMAAPAAGGAPGAPQTPAQPPAAKVAPATQKAATAIGTGTKPPARTLGKNPSSTPGAPTKSTGPVKSKKIPNNRRSTVSTGAASAKGSAKNTVARRASQGSPTKTTGGLKNRSVAKHIDPVGSGKIVKLLSSDYPSSSLGWIHDIPWSGPILLPSSAFDTASAGTWAAAHQKEKVEHFKQQMEHGVEKPVVAVKIPGSNLLRIVDGHHHFIAAKEASGLVPTYVGHANENSGPWDEMHLHQKVSSNPFSSKAMPRSVNKQRTITGQAGGVCLKAADTGRVLMLQRGLDHNDPASGKWEFPGGRRESLKESPESAGIREWQEETGLKMPRGKYTGHWISKNGVYHGLVRTVPHEADIPIQTGRRTDMNPDGDDIESLAWWHPDHLDNHPAIRPELAENMKRVKKAIKSEEPLEVQKSISFNPNEITVPEMSSFQDIMEKLTKSTDVSLMGGKYTGSNADQMIWNQDHGQVPLKVKAKQMAKLANSSKPTKKCDYCQRKATKLFVISGSDGVFARSCAIHAPQARAEIRWSANNQVSPVNANPYQPFPRVITQ